MSAQPECPYCNAKLFPHELINDECGMCGRRLSTAAGWSRPAPEGLPRPIDERLILWDRPPPEAFATVRQGIAVICWGLLCILIIGVLAALTLSAVVARDPQTRFPRDLLLMTGVFAAIPALAILVGVCFCCAVPRGYEARRWARRLISSFIVGSLLALVIGVDAALQLPMPNRGGPPWLDALFAFAFIFLLGFGFFGWFCCYMLLAALARLFGSRRLARALGAHLISTVCVLFFGGLGSCMGLVATAEARAATGDRMVGSIVLFIWFSLGVGLTIWFLLLMRWLYRLIPVPGPSEYRHEFRRDRWN